MVVTNQPPYVIGIDSGTQSLRTGIFDLQGNPLIFATKEYPTYFPKPAWAEQDAADRGWQQRKPLGSV